MRVASWIVATHFRPRLLRAALESIAANRYPPHWIGEVIVAHHADDAEGARVAVACGARPITTTQDTGGGKRNAALRHAGGDLVLVADDDDLQSPLRAISAIRALEGGASISETKEFRYLHLATGNVVRWCGRGDERTPGVIVGTARNYRRSLLARVGGWKPLPRLIEKDIQARIASRMPGNASRATDLSGDLADGTICLQHGENIWDDRPDVPPGQTVARGAFRLVGEGHWSQVPRFPGAVARSLGLS